MTTLVAGIDGGQSSTAAVIVDGEGTIRGRGTAGPSDHVDEPVGSTRAAEACESAVASALRAAKLPPDSPLTAVVVGMSGYDGDWHGRPPAFNSAIVRYKHDAVIALAGAIRERPSAVVIAGTGSAAYGETAHREGVRAGGFGYIFGDEGSSFWIARNALSSAMRAADRGLLSDLGSAALAFFDARDLRDIARAVSLHRIGRPELAAFSRLVHDAARFGDDEARAIIDEAATSLAGLAKVICEQLGGGDRPSVPVAFVGGGMDSPDFRDTVERRLLASTASARVIQGIHSPAVGAALLGFDAAGMTRPTVSR